MCNLYRMTKAHAQIARLFGACSGEGANFAAEVYPGDPGLVVAEDEARVAPRASRSYSKASRVSR